MKNRSAEVKVGIYDTAVELRYGPKYATLILPYVKWIACTGYLRKERYRFDRIADAGRIEKMDILFMQYDTNPSLLREYLKKHYDW